MHVWPLWVWICLALLLFPIVFMLWMDRRLDFDQWDLRPVLSVLVCWPCAFTLLLVKLLT